MVTKLFAGIDISANDAVLCCLDHDGNQLGPSRKFVNDLHGANELLDAITAFAANEVHIGLEATSVYGVHLRDFLVANGEANWSVYEINPSLVAGFKKSFPKRPKTDHQDAWLILMFNSLKSEIQQNQGHQGIKTRRATTPPVMEQLKLQHSLGRSSTNCFEGQVSIAP